MIRVVVISVRRTPNLVWWLVKRYEIGKPFMGWARDNGTFTAGFDATSEFGEASVFLNPEGAVAWAKEWGWHIESVMTR
jgi:hypothetical protein